MPRPCLPRALLVMAACATAYLVVTLSDLRQLSIVKDLALLTSTAGGQAAPAHSLASATSPHCGRTYPLPGDFRRFMPPYFFPNASTGCPPAPVLTARAWLSCLARRKGRLFIAGNSLGRGIAFAWQTLLNNMTTHPDRGYQKAVCAKSRPEGAAEIASCQLQVSVPQDLLSGTADTITPDDAAIRFMWRPRFWNTSSGDVYDFCYGQTPRACYEGFFSPGSRPGDVLVLQTGLAYVEQERLAQYINSDFSELMNSGVFSGTVVWLSTPLAHPEKSVG